MRLADNSFRPRIGAWALVWTLLILVGGRAAAASPPAVVINEIFYHAPEDRDGLQWIELHNPGTSAIALGGWKLAAGVQFAFQESASIPANGYLVLARDAGAFQQQYGLDPFATFKGGLKKGGERLELLDKAGNRVDAVVFDDKAPWPMSPDGRSASLERICPTAEGNLPANWTSSPLGEDATKPAGTPGERNAGFCATLPPVISAVRIQPEEVRPGTEVTVEATVTGSSPLKSVTLLHRSAGARRLGAEAGVPMTSGGGGRYRAVFRAPAEMAVLRMRIQAVDEVGATRFFPGEHEPRPALSRLVATNFVVGKIPLGFAWETVQPDPADPALARRKRSGANPQQDGFLRFIEFQVRAMANLGGLWMSLTLTQEVSASQWPVQAAFVKSLESKVDDILDELTGPDKMPEFERTATQRFTRLADEFLAAGKVALPAAQIPALAAFLEEAKKSIPAGNGPPPPGLFIRVLLPLENDYYYLTTATNFAFAAVSPLRKAFAAALAEREKLTARVADVFQGRGDFQPLIEARDRILAALQAELKAVLDADSRRRWSTWRAAQFSPIGGRGQQGPPEPAQGRHAFIFVAPGGAAPQLFDFVHLVPRGAGVKVHFLKDQPLNGMTAINLIYEYQDRFVLAEPLAYEVYRRVGNAACRTDFVRLWLNEEAVGLQLLVEQPNRAFLRANGLRDDGDLYKLLWYEQGVARQHEKKTNPATGHKQIESLVEMLKTTAADPKAQWQVIKTHFDVPQVINYFAVNMALSHWDGFFNNYFCYHDINGSKQWTLYPWDQDKTWGFHDGLQPGQEFFDMPLSFGMEGDTGPNGERAGDGPNVGHAWWRPGGWFSAPLLANPTFRKLYLARLREILEKDYTEAVFGPRLDAYRELLADEFRWRATSRKADPDQAVASLEAGLQSLRRHLVKRREFLLNQPELQNAPPFDKSLLR